MSITAPPIPQQSERPPYPVRRFSVAEYHRMIATGLLSENEPVELLDGWIALKMPHNPRHDATIALSDRVLSLLLPDHWDIRIQSAVTTDDSEPQPDLAVVRGSPRQYVRRHPAPADIGLLIEVAESSLEQDRTTKARIYARARIPVYWMVNLVDTQIEVYTEPGSATRRGYRRRRDYGSAASVPLVLAGRQIAVVPVAEFLP